MTLSAFVRSLAGVTGVVGGHGKRQANWHVFQNGPGVPTNRPSILQPQISATTETNGVTSPL